MFCLKSVAFPFRLWRYRPFWALTSLRTRIHSSLSSVRLLHPHIPSICGVSFRKTLDCLYATCFFYVEWQSKYNPIFFSVWTRMLGIWPGFCRSNLAFFTLIIHHIRSPSAVRSGCCKSLVLQHTCACRLQQPNYWSLSSVINVLRNFSAFLVFLKACRELCTYNLYTSFRYRNLPNLSYCY